MRPRQERKETGLTVKLEASPGSQPWASTLSSRLSQSVSSVARSCPTLCDPVNRSTPGLPVHHQLPEFTQTHVHRVGDAIPPSQPSWYLFQSRSFSRTSGGNSAKRPPGGAILPGLERGRGNRASPQAARAPPHPTAANQKLRWQQGAHCRGEWVILLRTSGFQTGNVTHTWREVAPGVCPGRRRLQTFLPDKFSRRRSSARLSYSGEGGNQAG